LSKLALGTVQFGLNYGINNKSGVIDDYSLAELLDYGFQEGIDTLDTAYNYGNSEARIGKYLSSYHNNFKLISKAPKGSNSQNIKKYFQESLGKLNSDTIYGYMLHDFDDYINDKKIFNSLMDLKQSGVVKKIGFSIYYPEQIEVILSDEVEFDLIQLPYNIADRRFEKYFEKLNNKGVEIHVRSVFLQGLFFMKSEELPENLKPFKEFLDKLNRVSKETSRTIENIALNFAAQNLDVGKVVIGIDNKEQLRNNLIQINNRIEPETLLQIKEELNKLDIPKELLIPSNWN
jgi:aryl-alcohol dehydrogenase-like predicted oxidoreductase